MRRFDFKIALALIGCALTQAISHADQIPALQIIPSETKVLILPALDETGDRADMVAEHVSFGNHRLEFEFLTRGFQVMGPEMALSAAQDNHLDLSDTDARDAATMKTLAADTGADWVVSADVMDVEETKSHIDKRRADAKVQIRVYSAQQDGWILDTFYDDHKDDHQSLSGTTGLFRAAIDTTLQRSLDNLVGQYPKVAKVYREFDQNDYLAGQNAPFLVDPRKPFGGLDNTQIAYLDYLQAQQRAQTAYAAPAPSLPISAPVTVAPVVSLPEVALPAPAVVQTPSYTAMPVHPVRTTDFGAATVRFTLRRGYIVVGTLNHYDSTADHYYVMTSTGMADFAGSDVASQNAVPAGS